MIFFEEQVQEKFEQSKSKSNHSVALNQLSLFLSSADKVD